MATSSGQVTSSATVSTWLPITYGQVSSGQTVVNGGGIGVAAGGSIVDETLASNGYVGVSGGSATSSIVENGGFLAVLSGGVATDTVVSSGGFIETLSGGVASDTTLLSSGGLLISGGSAVDEEIPASAIVTVTSGGVLVSATVDPGAYLTISATGQVSALDLPSGALVDFQGIPYDSSVYTTLDPTTDLLYLNSGGQVVDTISLAGDYTGLSFITWADQTSSGTPGTVLEAVSANYTARVVVSSAATVTGGGSVSSGVSSGGSVSSSTVSSSGPPPGFVGLTVYGGGGGVLYVSSGGTGTIGGTTVASTPLGPVVTNPGGGSPVTIGGTTVSAVGITELLTIAGAVIPVTTQPGAQTQFAEQVISAAAQAGNGETIAASSSPVSIAAPAPAVLDFTGGKTVVSGAVGVHLADVLLDTQGATYVTGATAVSLVAVADGANVTVENNGAGDALLAATGAAHDTLEGLAGANSFLTGPGGQDAVLLDGAVNALQSSGTDAVLVGGPSTITVAPVGLDQVMMTAGTTLGFINQSSAGISSVTGAAGGTVIIAGPGSTAVTAGAGTEGFVLDTSVGNTTLTGAVGGNDTFLFVKDLSAATSRTVVNAFASNDTVALHGYAGYSVTAAIGGALLSLSDGAQIQFNGVTAATVQQALKTV